MKSNVAEMTPVDEQILKLKIIVHGDNHSWGMGDTIEEAFVNAKKPKQYLVHIAHPDSTVDGMGGICSPTGYRPKLIFKKVKRK